MTLSSWIFLKTFLIRENGGKARGTYASIFVAGHPLPYNKGPVSMTCTVGVDVTGVTQKGLHLVFPLSELSLQMSGDTISTRSGPWYGVIHNPPECFESLGGVLQ